MTDTPQLLANVEFDIVKKGYEPEQVDQYLRKIDDTVNKAKAALVDAVEQAEVAQAKAAEAQRDKATAERALADVRAELDDARKAPAPPPAAPVATDEDDSTESLKKMLLLAQRTADSHVEEAQASAKN